MKPNTPGHRILIKPDSLDTVDPVIARARAAGFTITDKTEREEATIIDTGIVVQLGKTAYNDYGGRENWCDVGDRVSYTRHGGKMISDPDNKDVKYLVLNDEDIVMVWEKE